MSTLRTTLPLFILGACAPSLESALNRLPSTTPQAPATVSDSLIALGLEAFLAPFQSKHIILKQEGGLLSPRALPHRSLDFFLLDAAQIQHLADRTGDFHYLVAGEPTLAGDSAIVRIGNQLALRRRREPVVILSGGGCGYLFRRSSDGWHLARGLGCVTM